MPMQLPWLNHTDLSFPPTATALDDPNGLLAVGGDLSSERLLAAYQQGIFPWYEDDQPILWWSPAPRAVVFPDQIHISKSLAKRIRRNEYKVTFDQAFTQVLAGCSKITQKREGTWITDDMQAAYTYLYELGFAHSVESWKNDELVGGLYGVAIGRVFYGESMFSTQSDASKVAFVALAQQLNAWGFGVIDCQVSNPHLETLGSQEINRDAFDQLLQKFTAKPAIPGHWHTNWPNLGSGASLP